MPELLIANAFSLNMLPRDGRPRIPAPCDPQDLLRAWEGEAIRSVVGHADTAAVMSSILGREVPFNRETVTLQDHQVLLVGQYRGPRLPEGATELPEGATIEWWVL